jgi:hypothetical protein
MQERIEVIIHILNEEAFYAELDQMPNPADQFLVFSNPRRRDGRPVNFGAAGTITFIVPWHRITYVEFVPSERGRTDILDFVREER